MREFAPQQERAVVVVDDAMYASILRRQRLQGDFLRYEMRRSSDLNARFGPKYYAECLREFGLIPAYAHRLKPYLFSSLLLDVDDEEWQTWKKIATHLIVKGIMRRPKPLPPNRPIECWNDPDVEPMLVPTAAHREWQEGKETPWMRLEAKDERTQLRYAVQLAAAWIEEGVSPQNIIIANAKPEDGFFLKTLAKRYGFELSDDGRTPLIRLPSVARFWMRLEEADFETAYREVFADEADAISQSVRDILDSYIGLPDAKRWILFELEMRTVATTPSRGGVKLALLSQLSPLDDAKTIVLSACEGWFPTLVQDDGVLSDWRKAQQKMRTSIEENELRRRRIARIVESVEDIVLIVPAKIAGSPTVGIDPQSFRRPCRKLAPSETWYERSREDALFQYGALSHEARTYGVSPSLYNRLAATFQAIERYDPKFRGIDPSTNQRLLKTPTTLSATSLEVFFSCRFRYLLTQLLNMEPPFDSLSSTLGTAVHRRLEQLDTQDPPALRLTSDEYGKTRLCTFELATSRRLEKIVQRLLEHASQSAFQDIAHERSITVPIEGTDQFVLKGRIDRIMAHRLDNQDYLVVIDYKTGQAGFDQEAFQNGTDLQLMVYLELLRKHPEFKQARIAGFLIQPIPLGRLAEQDGVDDLHDRMRMKGYLFNRVDLARAFDSGGFVRSLAFKNDGTFHSRAKVFDSEQLDAWMDQLQRHLQNAVRQIEQGDYRITPIQKKSGESESVSCQYCPFAGICYSANRNLVEPDETIELEGDDAWQD